MLEQEPLVREAIEEAFTELDSERPKHEADVKRIERELHNVDRALDRYFRLRSRHDVRADLCPRIEELSRRMAELSARRDELAIEADEPEPLSDEDLRTLQEQVRDVILSGDPPQRKALLQALVEEIRVESRQAIYPVFSLPAVRPPCGSARPAGFEPAASRSGGTFQPSRSGAGSPVTPGEPAPWTAGRRDVECASFPGVPRPRLPQLFGAVGGRKVVVSRCFGVPNGCSACI